MTRKPNITPEDMGALYLKGEKVYKLDTCGVEPHAFMIDIVSGDTIEMPLSFFKDFVRLKPERPIPKSRKPRSDKGTRKELKVLSSKDIALKVDAEIMSISEQAPTSSGQVSPPPEPKLKKLRRSRGKSNPDIATFKVVTEPSGTYTLSMGKEVIKTSSLHTGALVLMSRFGITKADVEAAPTSEGKQTLLAIL